MIDDDDQTMFDKVNDGIRRGIRRAVLEHKKAGRSIAVWKNGRVETIPPEQIDVREDECERPAPATAGRGS